MRIQERFRTQIAPKLQQDLRVSHALAVPRVEKIVVSVGVSPSRKDAKVFEAVEQTLQRITGQKPIQTHAKKSIANFKIREGMTVGYKVTLRGVRMWDFLTRLTVVAFPRVRDFRGIASSCVDAQGNCSIGFREHTMFPEIRSDEVEHIHGLQVTVSTSAGSHEKGVALFRALGFPFHT